MNAEIKPSLYTQTANNESLKPGKTSAFKRFKLAGAALTALLAAELGVIAIAKNTNQVSAEVSPQTTSDLLNTKGDFETTPCPTPNPSNWEQIVNDGNFPPIYHCEGNPPPLVNFTGNSSVEVDYSANGTTYTTNGWKYTGSFAANPDQTITEQFAAAYETNEAGVTVKPQTKITWKDVDGNVTGTDTFSPSHTRPPDNWEEFSRTYGPGGVAIPANTVSGTIEVGIVGSGGTTSNGIKGLEFIDSVLVMGPVPPTPTSTPPLSVGGIAGEVDPSTLPTASNSPGENNSELLVILGGSAIGLLGAGAAGAWKIRSMNREEFGKDHK